jgi:YtkA-like protein
MQLRAPVNRTYSAAVYPEPASAWSRESLLATVYTAAVLTIVFVGVGIFAARSDSIAPASTTPQAKSSSSVAGSGHGVNAFPVLRVGAYRLRIESVPRHLGESAVASVKVLKGGRPVNGARVRLVFSMPNMPSMRGLFTVLRQTARGVYAHTSPILTVGRWLVTVQVTLRHSAGFRANFSYRIRA